MVLICISINISNVEHVSCTCWPSEYLLWKNVYSGPLPILKLDYLGFLLLSCMSSLFILDINPLTDVWMANIFFHSVSGLFILLIIYFAMQKLFSLMQYHLFFYYVACALGIIKLHCRHTEFEMPM